jgi:hypothetical protein
LVLIVKEEMALGWKGFAPQLNPSILESLALPLGVPSMFRIAVEAGTFFRGVPPAEGDVLQRRLWKLLRGEPPREVIVVLVRLGDRPVNLVYGHTIGGAALPDARVTELLSLAASAATGYARIIQRAKQR